jgi:hypothetical protein
MSTVLHGILLRLFREAKASGSPVLFRNHQGAPLRTYALPDPFQNAVKRAKLEDFHFHDLRHTFASRLIMAGVDIRTIQELMGHKTIAMTLRYSHLSPRPQAQGDSGTGKPIFRKKSHQFSQYPPFLPPFGSEKSRVKTAIWRSAIGPGGSTGLQIATQVVKKSNGAMGG